MSSNEKSTFWHVHPVMTQISLRIRIVWSVFIVCLKELCHWLSKMRPVKILIRLPEYAGWSESSLGAHVRKYVCWRHGSLNVRKLNYPSSLYCIFFVWVLGPFKNISLIPSRSFIKGRRKPENPGKTTWPSVSRTWLSHVTRVKLEPQRWETLWCQLSNPLGYGGPHIILRTKYPFEKISSFCGKYGEPTYKTKPYLSMIKYLQTTYLRNCNSNCSWILHRIQRFPKRIGFWNVCPENKW